MNECIYTIYRILCLLNNKVYIGYTKKPAKDRFKEHMKSYFLENPKFKFAKAIKKYGPENFIFEEIYQSKFRDDILKMEDKFIIENNSIKEGYNTARGGQGGTLDNKGKFTAYDSNTGNYEQISIEDSRYISGELVGCTAKQVTVRDANNNCFNVSTTDERYLSGELSFVCSGRKFSTESKIKIGNAQKQRLKRKNVHNGIVNIFHEVHGFKKVHPNELDRFLHEGWIRKHPSSDTIIINKDGKNSRATENNLQEKLADGWKIGGKSMLSFTNGNKVTKVYAGDIEKIEKLISDGFTRGSKSSSKT